MGSGVKLPEAGKVFENFRVKSNLTVCKVTFNCTLGYRKKWEQDVLIAPPIILLGSSCSISPLPCSLTTKVWCWTAFRARPGLEDNIYQYDNEVITQLTTSLYNTQTIICTGVDINTAGGLYIQLMWQTDRQTETMQQTFDSRSVKRTSTRMFTKNTEKALNDILSCTYVNKTISLVVCVKQNIKTADVARYWNQLDGVCVCSGSCTLEQGVQLHVYTPSFWLCTPVWHNPTKIVTKSNINLCCVDRNPWGSGDLLAV